MKQTRQAVPLSSLCYLDVYDLTYLYVKIVLGVGYEIIVLLFNLSAEVEMNSTMS